MQPHDVLLSKEFGLPTMDDFEKAVRRALSSFVTEDRKRVVRLLLVGESEFLFLHDTRRNPPSKMSSLGVALVLSAQNFPPYSTTYTSQVHLKDGIRTRSWQSADSLTWNLPDLSPSSN